MKSSFRFGAAAALLAATLVGCDWGGVSSEESWNDAYAWANFSGTYRLVTKLTTNGIDTIVGINGSWSGSVGQGGEIYTGQANLVPGSVAVTWDGFTWSDTGNKLLTGSDGSSGTVDYATGTITLDPSFSNEGVAYVSYQYTGAAGGGSLEDGGILPAVQITWLNVVQKGNIFTMEDNEGRSYSGKITGASCPDADAGGYVQSGHIRFSFEATCTSDPRYTISGSLAGDWSGAQNETSGTIANRTMDATFSDGKEHTQFQAVSGSVTVVAGVTSSTGSI